MTRRILIAFILAGTGLIAALVIYFLNRQIPMSPYNSGNIAGNMLNGGLFFEMNGKVYFANFFEFYHRFFCLKMSVTRFPLPVAKIFAVFYFRNLFARPMANCQLLTTFVRFLQSDAHIAASRSATES